MSFDTDNFKANQAGIRIARMTPEILTSVVTLEVECGLNSRGIEGYRKSLLDPGAVLLVAIEGDGPVIGRVIGRVAGRVIGRVAGRVIGRVTGRVIGAFSGAVVVDELQIDNLAVSDRWRRMGVGQDLLREALKLAKGLGAHTATLEVRSSNLPARSLYQKEGFEIDGFRSRYYAAPQDDALLLSREI